MGRMEGHCHAGFNRDTKHLRSTVPTKTYIASLARSSIVSSATFPKEHVALRIETSQS